MEHETDQCKSNSNIIEQIPTILQSTNTTPITSSCNVAYFPTVFEEEFDTFSHTSSDNDERDALGTFVEDAGLWSPTNDDMGTIYESTFDPIYYQNIKPRRRLPMVTKAVSRTSHTVQSNVENGSCSFDSGISRLLSSVDKAVSSVTSKTIKKSEFNKMPFSPSDKRDKKSILPTSSIISFANSLTTCQSPPVTSPMEVTANSPSKPPNISLATRSDPNTLTSSSPISKCFEKRINSRRYSDHVTSSGLCVAKDHLKISHNENSSSPYLRTTSSAYSITKSIPSSPVRSRHCLNNYSKQHSPSLGRGPSFHTTELEDLDRHSNVCLESQVPNNLNNFASPPLSPSITYCSSVSSLSPKLARIGRRMLPEPPKPKANQNLKDRLTLTKCDRESLNTLVEHPNRPSSTDQGKTSSSLIVTTINSSLRPSVIHQIHSNVTTSIGETHDQISLGNDTSISPGSNSSTSYTTAVGTTWHSISSRDSLDSGFFSTGHSRSTTCDSTSSNVSAGSLFGASKGTLSDTTKNLSSPNSNRYSKNVSSNESPPFLRRQYRLMSNEHRVHDLQDAISDGEKKGSNQTSLLNAPFYDDDSKPSSSLNFMQPQNNNNVDVSQKQSTYNRVQSLPNHDTPEKLMKDSSHLQHQKSLPSNSYLFLTSDLHQDLNCSINPKQTNILEDSCGDTLDSYVNFSSSEPHATNSNTLNDSSISNYNQNNQRKLGAQDVFCSPTCDNKISYFVSSHGEEQIPHERKSRLVKNRKVTEDPLVKEFSATAKQSVSQIYSLSDSNNTFLTVEHTLSDNDISGQTHSTCKHDCLTSHHTHDFLSRSNDCIYEEDELKQSSKKSTSIVRMADHGLCSSSDESYLFKSRISDINYPRLEENKMRYNHQLETQDDFKNGCAFTLDRKHNDMQITKNHSIGCSFEVDYAEENLLIDKTSKNYFSIEPLITKSKIERNCENVVFQDSKQSDSESMESYTSASYRRYQWLSIHKYNNSG